MKLTATLLIGLLFTTAVQAQMTCLYNGEPYAKRYELEDSIKAIFPERTFAKDSSLSFKAYGFRLTDSTGKQIIFDFKKFMRGENKDLEIKGTESIMRMEVYGSYSDLFAIWKAFINPKADKTELLKNGYERMTAGNCNLWFHNTGDSWEIKTIAQPVK